MSPTVIYLCILVGILVLLTIIRLLASTVRIASAHVINLEESKERLYEFQENARAAFGSELSVVRWPAYDSRNMTEEQLAPLKLSKYIWKWAVENKKMGMLGCYLSHRSLLTHLEKTNAAQKDAHLILEDDAYIPPDFLQKWAAVLADAPPDWEILQLGVTFPNLRRIRGSIHRHLGDKGNGGTFAYVVRHSALPKINAHLAYMTDPIDIMFRNKWRDWKYYIVYPEICPHNDHGESIIVEK
jgi:GR25 family glycosyltransferase involved in LPS biosynthesis